MWLATGCEAFGAADPLVEACEHLTSLPTPLASAASPVSAPAVAAHTRYDVTLPDAGGGRAAPSNSPRPCASSCWSSCRPTSRSGSSPAARTSPREKRKNRPLSGDEGLVRIRSRRRFATRHAGRIGQHRDHGGTGSGDGSRCPLTAMTSSCAATAWSLATGAGRSCRRSTSPSGVAPPSRCLGEMGRGRAPCSRPCWDSFRRLTGKSAAPIRPRAWRTCPRPPRWILSCRCAPGMSPPGVP